MVQFRKMTLEILLVLSLLLSSCEFKSVYFQGGHTAVAGLPYEAICSIESEKYNSRNLTITLEFSDEDYPNKTDSQFLQIINETTVRFYYQEIPSEFTGKLRWLTCLVEEDDDDEYTDYLLVSVKRPNNKPKINNDTIIVDNWEYLLFTWNQRTNDHNQNRLKLTYRAWYKNDSENAVYVQCDNGNGTQCKIVDPFSITDPGHFLKIVVIGSATDEISSKTLEEKTSKELRVNLNQFVKPAKVMNIEVLQSESSFTIAFKPTKLNRNITYNVLIECDRPSFKYTENITTEIKSDDHIGNNDLTTETSKGNSISHRFLGPLPFSKCNAFVRAISVAGGKWSEWNTRSFETVEGVPLHNPQICSSCFSVHEGNFDSTFDVVVYFTPLSEESAQGKVVLYRIRILEKNTSKEHIENLNITETNHFSLLLNNLSKQIDYEIWIEAKTSKGFNHMLSNSKAIDVSFKARSSFSYPRNLKLVFLNCATVNASWEMDDNDCQAEKKVFLFWCEGNAETKTCTDVLQWRNVSSSLRSDIITPFSDDLMYGVGFECNGISSGILWNACIEEADSCPGRHRLGACEAIELSQALPDVQRLESSEEPGTPDESYSVSVIIIPVSILAPCLLFAAAVVLKRYWNRFAHSSGTNKISVIIPPTSKATLSKCAPGTKPTCQITQTFGNRTSNVSSEKCIVDLTETSVKTHLLCDLDQFTSDEEAVPLKESSQFPKSESTTDALASIGLETILPPITDFKVKTRIENILIPTDSLESATVTSDGRSGGIEKQMLQNILCSDDLRMQWSSASQADSSSECMETSSYGSKTTQDLVDSGYAFCKGEIPVVILPVPNGQAQPIAYEE